MREPRVVVTGVGPVSPAAVGGGPFWALFRDHVEGRSPMSPSGAMPADVFGSSTRFRHADTLTRLALAAVALALEDAGLDPSADGGEGVGVALGSGFGCLAANLEYLHGILERGSRFGNPVVFQHTVPNAPTGYASVAHSLRGPTATFSAGLTAGLEALDFAFRQVAERRVPAMVVASADQFFPQLTEVFGLQGWLSPRGVPRPLDRERDGTVLSEGSCALVLEDLDWARARGARIYAEICGTGQAGGRPESGAEALAEAVAQALDGACAGRRDLGVVFSSASGAREADRAESRGLVQALRGHAGSVPTTCPKSLLGETLGSCGTMAATLAALCLASGWVPPTAHYRDPDPECALNVSTGEARRLDPEAALVTGLGEQGGAQAVVLRRWAA
jgi:3-oxoacyl-(acyl-carrier-protein) synthase